jgi:hypothetical protein
MNLIYLFAAMGAIVVVLWIVDYRGQVIDRFGKSMTCPPICVIA